MGIVERAYRVLFRAVLMRLDPETAHHAAMLFIDFALSVEGQTIYRELGYVPPRKGMAPADLPPLQKLYLTNRPNYIADYENWARLYQNVFVRRKM